MTATVTTQFKTQFDSALRLAAQQKNSRLQSLVTDRGMVEGNAFTINNLGSAGLLDENVVRHGDTTWSEITHTARLVYMRDYFKALPLDRNDIPKMAANPLSGGQYMQSLIAARNRRIDNIIYQAALGTIPAADGSASYTLPAGQKIVVGGTGLTKAKIIAARALFRANEADELSDDGDFPVMLYNSLALTQILSDTTLTSGDYMTGQMLQQGKLDTAFLGFKWVPYEALNVSGGVYSTVAFVKSAIHFGKGFEEGDVAKRPDKKNTWQVSMAGSYGAGRQDEAKVVQIDFQ